jgi:hypothetical protein
MAKFIGGLLPVKPIEQVKVMARGPGPGIPVRE